MAGQKSNKSNDARPISLAPLTPDEALAAALRIKPEDMAKLEAEDRAKKKRAAKKRKK